jgi:MFS family permease
LLYSEWIISCSSWLTSVWNPSVSFIAPIFVVIVGWLPARAVGTGRIRHAIPARAQLGAMRQDFKCLPGAISEDRGPRRRAGDVSSPPMKIFYGWKMVGAALGLQFLQAALLHHAFGAYVATFEREFGWSKTALSAGAALQSIEAAVLGPALGWIVDRFGAQHMIRAGILVFGAGFLLLASVDSLTGFYAAVFTIAIGSSLCGYFPLTVAVVQWFEKKRARALSTMSMGLALGGVFVPAVAWTMQTFGWRTTALASAALSVAIGWPLARVFRRRPEDVGETIDGLPAPSRPPHAQASPAAAPTAHGPARAPSTTPAGRGSAAQSRGSTPEPENAVVPREFTAREAMRTAAFWLLTVGHGFALLVVSAVNVHAITHMNVGLGYSLAQASLFVTLMTVAQAGGVMLGWAIGDRFDKRWISAACMLMHAGGLLMLTYAAGSAWLVAFALLHGIAWGLRGPFMQALRADYFGRRSIGMILGISAVFIAIGQVAGPMVAGGMADLTGDYRTGFTLLALLAASGSLAFLLARRPW